MYSAYNTFPLGSPDYTQAKTRLNQYSSSEVQEALSKNVAAIKDIILAASPGSYLSESLIEYVDQIIKSNIALGDNPGDAISDKLEDLYNKEYILSQKEQDLIKEANKFNPDDTLDVDISAALKAHTRAEDSKDFVARDEKTKLLEKAMFLGLFNDFTRLHKSQNTKNLELKQLQNTSGSWEYVADSFVGGHTLAVNSDSYALNNGSNNLIGVVADGVTNSPETPKVFFGGHYLAKALTDTVQNFDFQGFNGNNPNSINKKDLDQEEEKTWSSISQNIIEFFAKLNQDGFTYNPAKDFFSQCIQFLNKQNKPEMAKAISEESLQAAISAMAPLYSAINKISDKLKATYLGAKQPICLASTLQYAVVIGNKIVTVNLGDSDIACYDANQKKLNPKTKFRQLVPQEQQYIDNTKLVRGNYLSLNLNQDQELEALEVPPAYVIDGGATKIGRHYIGELNISIYNKDDVDQIMICSDGCLDSDKKVLPEDIDKNPKQNFVNLISHGNTDDKTAIVLKKAS